MEPDDPVRLTEIKVNSRPVAAARIGLGIALLFITVEMFKVLSGIAEGMVALPVHEGIPAPTVQAVTAYAVIAVAAGVAVIVGWRTAAAAAVSTALNVWVLLWDQQSHSSERVLVTLLVAYLIFARSDASWSVSRSGGGVPWWPQLLMMTQVSVCYFFGAVSKVSVHFLSGVPLSQWIWLSFPWWVFTLMALVTVVVELFLAFGLWFQRTRLAAVCLGMGLHTSIMVMLAGQKWVLLGFAVTCLCIYPLFLSRPSMSLARSRCQARKLAT